MFDVVSGNIVANILYQVIGGTSIVYNSITYNANEYFAGIDAITTYTKTAGTEVVTYASQLNQSVVQIQQDIYEGLTNEESSFLAETAGGAEMPYFEEQTIEDFTQDGKNLIPAQSKCYIAHQVPEITALLGNELYEGVSYDRLLELEGSHAEITLTLPSSNNVSKIDIDGQLIFMRMI